MREGRVNKPCVRLESPTCIWEHICLIIVKAAFFPEMLDCCMRENGWRLLQTKSFMLCDLKGEIHIYTFPPKVPAAPRAVSNCLQDFFPPLRPGWPVKASKQQTSSFLACGALLCPAISKILLHASSPLNTSSFLSLPPIVWQ